MFVDSFIRAFLDSLRFLLRFGQREPKVRIDIVSLSGFVDRMMVLGWRIFRRGVRENGRYRCNRMLAIRRLQVELIRNRLSSWSLVLNQRNPEYSLNEYSFKCSLV